MKAVLFDIDGTLVHAGGAGARALDKAVKELYGVDKVCEKFCLQGSTDKTNFETAIREASGRKKPGAAEVKKLQALYVRHLPGEIKRSVKDGKYFNIAGVEGLLKLLKSRKDVLVGLGTGNLKDGAFLKLGPSGLTEYFAFGGYGCDSHERSEVLQKAVERASKLAGKEIGPGGVYVIGDTHKDVLAAKEACYHSAAVTAGFGDPEMIRRSAPELVAKDFTDLTPWLLWLGLERDPKGVRRGTYICPDSPIEHAHYGRTGADLKDIDDGIEKLREMRKRTVRG